MAGRTLRDKFNSRKYRMILFWNILAGVSVVLQTLLSWQKIPIQLPLEIIVGIAGILTGGYLGINVWEKRVVANNPILPPNQTS